MNIVEHIYVYEYINIKKIYAIYICTQILHRNFIYQIMDLTCKFQSNGISRYTELQLRRFYFGQLPSTWLLIILLDFWLWSRRGDQPNVLLPDTQPLLQFLALRLQGIPPQFATWAQVSPFQKLSWMLKMGFLIPKHIKSVKISPKNEKMITYASFNSDPCPAANIPWHLPSNICLIFATFQS